LDEIESSDKFIRQLNGLDVNDEEPNWKKYDKIVLRFSAYYTETFPAEHSPETSRIRNVEIYFYLENDSVQIYEAVIPNSGLPQGTVLKRGVVMKPDNKQHLTIMDFNVGKDIEIYGRVYHILGCDLTTRELLKSFGFQSIPENKERPKDESIMEAARKKGRGIDHNKPPSLAGNRVETKLKQFLENDKKVLKFYGVWDDSKSKYGSEHEMIIYYFLADDTIEVCKKCAPGYSPSFTSTGHSGGLTIFLRRQKVPKIGFSSNSAETKNLSTNKNLEFYRPKDFVIGSDIDIYGRKIKLTGCDETILRFSAKLATDKKVDKDRDFVVSFFPVDGSFFIFEQHKQNSGIKEGKYLERGFIRRPDGHYYKSTDLQLGNTLVFWKHPFILTGVDEFTKNYVSNHKNLFPLLNV
jgi:hypothetical protein